MPSALYSMNSISCLTRCTASKNIEESIATHSPPGVTINNRIMAKFILIFSRAALSSTLWAVCQGLAVERSALRIDYCGLGPFSSTPSNLMIFLSLLKVLICIIH